MGKLDKVYIQKIYSVSVEAILYIFISPYILLLY